MPVVPHETERAFQDNNNSNSSLRNHLILEGHQTPPPPQPGIVDERDDISSSSSPMSTTVPTIPLQPSNQNNYNDAAAMNNNGNCKPPAAAAQWPCANCHATVSQDRCPFCHGIQVKIYNKNEVRTLPEQAWIERVSPTTIRGTTPLSSTPPFSKGLVQPSAKRRLWEDRHELVEINDEEDEDDEVELLEQASSSESLASPRQYGNENDVEHAQQQQQEVEAFLGRPNNPVALLLATAESPLPNVKQPWMDTSPEQHASRDELKKQSKERVVEDAGAAGKKQRILFAMS